MGDYQQAIADSTGLVLKAHTSNYLVRGFTKSVPATELAALARAQKIPFVHDLGSGALVDQAVRRGDVVLDPALHAPTARIDAKLCVLRSEPKSIEQWFPVKLHHAAAEVPGRVVILRDEPIRPGDTEFVQLVLERPLAAAVGDRFVIRDTSSCRTIGGGMLVDLRAPERRRRTPERRAQLEALAEQAAAMALKRVLAGPPGWIDVDAFFRDRAMGPRAVSAIVSDLGLVTLKGTTAAMLPANWEDSGLGLEERWVRSMPSGRTYPVLRSSSCASLTSRCCLRPSSYQRSVDWPRLARSRSTVPGFDSPRRTRARS